MSIEVTSLTDLDTNDVSESLARQRQLLSEYNPDAKVIGGVIDELLLRSSALLDTVHRQNFDRLKNSQSLQAIREDPTLVDDDVLDSLASNYGVTRAAAASATGQITIVISSSADTVIAAGAKFTGANGRTYLSDLVYTARANGNDVIADNDRLISTLSDGTYAFTIDATAEETGEDGNISMFTSMVPETPPANYLAAYASSDFTGGADAETTDELIDRLQVGMSNRSIDTRQSIEATIRDYDGLANIVALSVIGYGDPEQIRYHTIFPVAIGSRIDGYLRTSGLVSTKTLTKTATLISKVGAEGTWQFSLTRDDAPGFYEISKVLLTTDVATEDTFEITQDTRGYDVTVDTGEDATNSTKIVPDVTSALEAAYSRYQTGVIQFVDDRTDATSLTVNVSTKDYAVYVSYLEGIEDAQDAVSARAVRSLSGDCLIKAAVPCFVTLTVTVNRRVDDPELDEDALKQAAVNAVNNVNFTGKLSASTVSAAVQNALVTQGATKSTVANVSIGSRLRKPNGSEVTGTTTTTLTIANDYANMVSARTVVFFTKLTDVTMTVVDVDAPEV